MKQLTKAIFSSAPKWVKSAAINADGEVYWYNASKDQLSQTHCEHFISVWITRRSKFVGKHPNPVDWQNSAIDRKVKS